MMKKIVAFEYFVKIKKMFKYQIKKTRNHNNKTKEKKMSSCLGLYIENNLIKYAKVSKDHDNVKIDSYGIKFYDNIYDQ